MILAIQAIIGVLLTFAILLQHRGSGLSAGFAGQSEAYVQRRGAERLLFRSTIWLSVFFFGLTIVQWYL
jgi:protein translocase SecG subunit